MTRGAAAVGLDDWLRVVLPRLSGELCDAESRSRLTALGCHLPGSCAAILEVRLTPPSRQVDLSLCVRDSGAARQLAGAVPAPAVRRLLERWAAGGLPPISSLWLEWDLDERRATGASPPPDGPAVAVPGVIAKLGAPAEPGWVVGELLPALAGKPLAPRRRRLAERCLAAIPAIAPVAPSGRLLYAFGLLGRTGQPLRLEICGFDLPALVSYLELFSADHAQRMARLAPLFADIADPDRLHLSFDLQPDGTIGPRFGVEGSLARLPRREPRWTALFERLVAARLCDPARRDATLAWPGWDSFRTAPEVWPVAGLAEGGLAGFCARALSHVKVVSWPDRPPEAKAYLAFNAVPTRPAAPAGPPMDLPRDPAGARPPDG
jgi:hypothetical protein